MSNVNTLKAIQCLIGSNCIVSTPDAFYVGPKGLISNAEIVQTLDEHNTRISANTSNIVSILADIQSIYEDINTITALSNNTKIQLDTLLGKVTANTSNINVLQGDLNTVNDDINTLKTTLNSNNERLNGEILLLKDTDDAIYETFNEISGLISNNTLNILMQLDQLNYINSIIPQPVHLTSDFTVLAQDLELGYYVIRFMESNGTVNFLGYIYKYKTKASTIGILGIMSDGTIEERDENIGVHNYRYISGQWLEI